MVIAGLSVFGVLFAINSSLHSYLIVSYAAEDGVSLDVGFYYMANAMGRLLGHGALGLDVPALWPRCLPWRFGAAGRACGVGVAGVAPRFPFGATCQHGWFRLTRG